MGITTTTNYGRAQVAWPDFAHDGGSALHTKIVNGIKKISDSLVCRFTEEQTLANGATFDFTHSFGLALEELDIAIYESNRRLSLQERAGYAITQLSTDQIRITNQSGGSKTFFALVFGARLNPGRQAAFGTTNNATPTALLTYDIPTDKAALVVARVCGRKDGTTAGAFEIKALVEDNGGTAAVSLVEKTTLKDAPAWDVSVVASGGTAVVQVTGEAATTIDWTATLETTFV